MTNDSVASREQARLCVIEDRLRAVLEQTPEVRTLLLAWIDLKFGKESRCPKNPNSNHSNRAK